MKILGLWLGVFCFLKATPYLYLGEEPKNIKTISRILNTLTLTLEKAVF